MLLRKGKYIPVPKERNTWWEKAWDYKVEGIIIARIYKQVYPGDEHYIYRYSLNGLHLLPSTWKSTQEFSIESDHYPNKKAATKAIKKAIKKYILILCSFIKPE